MARNVNDSSAAPLTVGVARPDLDGGPASPANHEPVRVGVVLSGGGVRGAYQAGFLRGLSKTRVEIVALSGTSVGALNAYAYSRVGAEALVAYWEQCALDRKFLRLRPFSGLTRIPLVAVFMVAYWPYLFRWAIRSRMNRLRNGGDTHAQRLAPLPWLFSIVHRCSTPQGSVEGFDDGEGGFWLAWLVFAMVVPLYVLVPLNVIGPLVWIPIVIYYGALVAAFHFDRSRLAALLAKRRTSFLALDFMPLLTEFAERTGTPGSSSGVPRLFICTSALRHAFRWHDPRCLRVAAADPRHVPVKKLVSNGEVRGQRVCELVPVYRDITSEPVHRQLQVALASAALPFGIVPARAVEGGEGRHAIEWDGGILDNVPLAPMAEVACDEVIVVDIGLRRWSASLEETLRLYREAWAYEHARRIECIAARLFERRAGLDDGRHTLARLSHWLEICVRNSFRGLYGLTIHHVSSGRLGGRLGTLYLTSRAVRKLILAGEREGESLGRAILEKASANESRRPPAREMGNTAVRLELRDQTPGGVP